MMEEKKDDTSHSSPQDSPAKEIDSLVKAMMKKENLLLEKQPSNTPTNPLSNLKNLLSHADATASSSPPEKPETSKHKEESTPQTPTPGVLFHFGPVVELDKLIKAHRAARLK